jgi:hypothetical protein
MEAKKITVTEFTACAECDSQEPRRAIGAGDEILHVCPDCETMEGATKTLWLNEATDEVTADMAVANGWEKPACRIEGPICMSTTNAPGTKCEKCGKDAFND